MNYAQTIISGRLTRQPELKTTPSGVEVCTFSVAVSHAYVQNGEKKEKTEFYNVVTFGKQAVNSNQFLVKGQQVLVAGRMSTRSWDDKDSGKKMYRTDLIAEYVQFGSKPKNGSNSSDCEEVASNDFATVENQKEVVNNQNAVASATGFDYGPAINPEDIPF